MDEVNESMVIKYTINEGCDKASLRSVVEWLSGFKVGLGLRNRLLTTVWETPLRKFQKHVITILILPEECLLRTLEAGEPVYEDDPLTVAKINEDLSLAQPHCFHRSVERHDYFKY